MHGNVQKRREFGGLVEVPLGKGGIFGVVRFLVEGGLLAVPEDGKQKGKNCNSSEGDGERPQKGETKTAAGGPAAVFWQGILPGRGGLTCPRGR